jgi:KUP system potassium uptake protein
MTPTDKGLQPAAAEGASGHAAGPVKPHGFMALCFGSIGVVFGDIGTSPLYAMREALAHSRGDGMVELAALGVVSLAFWSLLLVVTLKYVIFLMNADNKGEGGTLALMALAQRSLGRRSTVVMVLGVCGAALFYGDGIITPAVSVLGAMEGLGEAPGLGPVLKPFVLPLAIGLLVGLFLVQSRGTAFISRFFSPIITAWFLTLAGLGLVHIFDDISIFRALSPHYAVTFLLDNGVLSLAILGSIFLAVTGAEALYADMGHFGKSPIRAAWLCLVLPCLTLNYLGQGALVLSDPGAAENPFFKMIPTPVYWPVLLLATAAAAIASQAVITGAFSLTQQAVQLGLLPRLRILRTSETQSGQIFVPQVNAFLMVGVIALLVTLRTSSNLAAAYGIAVTGAMLIDTLLFFVIIRWLWKKPMWQAVLAVIVFGSLDLVFLGSNLLKIPQGGWIPLVLGASLVIIMLVWSRGVQVLSERTARESMPLADLLVVLNAKSPHRIEGTAIFLTADPDMAPTALMHNLKHNRVLHARNIILSIQTATTPTVAAADRARIDQIDENFCRVQLSYGFMETPNVPQALANCRTAGALKFDIMQTSFFLSRRSLKASPTIGLPLWQDYIFIFLMKNAGNPTDFFQLPANRVIEMGEQVIV